MSSDRPSKNESGGQCLCNPKESSHGRPNPDCLPQESKHWSGQVDLYMYKAKTCTRFRNAGFQVGTDSCSNRTINPPCWAKFRLLENQTVESCSKICIRRSWCKSFAYQIYWPAGTKAYLKKCYLSDKSPSAEPYKYTRAYYDHYDCESLRKSKDALKEIRKRKNNQ